MAYTKHNWQNGETITDDLLNNMESGIEEANTRAMTPVLKVKLGRKGQRARKVIKASRGKGWSAVP